MVKDCAVSRCQRIPIVSILMVMTQNCYANCCICFSQFMSLKKSVLELYITEYVDCKCHNLMVSVSDLGT